ncbi:thiamine transporter substrate binding subunit [Primorskyibacter flagellatus]|uniref:Thiamine transporter substrate binding subunit n=1 Tax=Primorskyibacter flagellatus TaxID=1387277 RepID=A0A917A9C1_9RHOB|nr:thiamine ABC transporter substrate binding subunit [Primorskyibacter flagellatus]GGE36654.1 thiamine transporter substrate binding subunit [Primorskyibacter flagellatus]
MKHLIAATGVILATQAVAETPVLTIYTYDSFATEWGPGPQIEQGFEADCGCDLQWVTAGDGAALLSRLRLEGEGTQADVVLGLDTNLTAAAADTGLFAPHGVSAEFDLPVDWTDDTFVPFDWGYFAFVGNAGAAAPKTFRDLADSDLRVVIQDPRSSTPGLGLLLWVKYAYGEEAGELWSALKDNIVTVTPGWSEAYGMFLDGEADLVLSYTTSPAYHIIAEEDQSKVALPFEEGHYMQIEVAGMVAGTDQPDLAKQFLAYLVSDAAQSVIPTTNWMYPAVMPENGLPEGFGSLIQPDQSLLIAPEEVPATRDAALEEWRAALSR